jgi:hypothetical protein
VESSEPGLAEAASGLAAQPAGRITVFAPLPAVAPQARAVAVAPPVVILAVKEPAAGAEIGDWLARYVESYPQAAVVCTAVGTVDGRSARIDTASRNSARDAVSALLRRDPG